MKAEGLDHDRALPWVFLLEALPARAHEYWTPAGPTERTFKELEEGFRLSNMEAVAVRLALDYFNGSGKASCQMVLQGFSSRPRKALIRFLAALETTETQRAYLQEALARARG